MVVAISQITFGQSQPDSASISKDTILENQLLHQKTTWGIKAGWNQNNLYGKEIDYIFANDQTKYESGFHAGIFVDTWVSKHFGLKHELLFSQNRIGITLHDTNDAEYKSKLTMSYIDLMPANLTFKAGGFQLYTGVYISALLDANVEREDENGNMYKDKSIFGSPENEETESHYLQKFDFGANFGFEYRFNFGLSVGAKYTHGFTDLFQFANSYANEDPKTDSIKIYKKGFMVSLGYSFGRIKI